MRCFCSVELLLVTGAASTPLTGVFLGAEASWERPDTDRPHTTSACDACDREERGDDSLPIRPSRRGESSEQLAVLTDPAAV